MDNYNSVRISAYSFSSSGRARTDIIPNRCSDTVFLVSSFYDCLVRVFKRKPMGRDLSCVAANISNCGEHDPFKRGAALHEVFV